MKMIWLTRGQFTLVDDEDYDELSKHKWHAMRSGKSNTFYAGRDIWNPETKKSVKIPMHREIMKPIDTCIKIDHKDRNGLDNRRINLRLATHKQNQSNVQSHKDSTSKYLGVGFCKAKKKFRARIFENGKEIWLGYYLDEIDAAKAYNKAAERVHGEFANLNKV